MSLRKTMLAAAVTAAMGFGATAYAGYAMPEPAAPADHWYVGFSVGAAFTPDTNTTGSVLQTQYDTGWGAGVQVGYKSGPMRYEGEVFFARSSIDKIGAVAAPGHLRATTGMLNVIYDFGDASSSTNPYIGLGLGYGNIKTSGLKSDDEFVYGARAGLAFSVADDTDVDVGYRYFRTGNAANSLGNDDYQNHVVTVGIIHHLA